MTNQSQQKKAPRIIYVRALDCVRSKDNIRTVSNAERDAELATHIGKTAIVIQNLVGLAMRGKDKGKWEIYAGGRRIEGVHASIANGELPEDYEVPLLPARNKAEALSLSLAENVHPLPMNPADQCRAFQTVIKAEKISAADLAAQHGMTEKFVLGRLRLANLAPVVFEALRAGELTLEIAKAYGWTSDTDRQARVFEQVRNSYSRSAGEIQRMVTAGSYKGADPKARLVGRDAYIAAGGTIDADLYSDHDTETWRDGALVDRLADEAMTAAAEEFRQQHGFAEVRPLAAASVPYLETYELDAIEPEPLPMSDEASARQAEIEGELAGIEKAAEEEDAYTDEQIARIEELEAERDELVQGGRELTDAQKACSIAYVLLDKDGKPHLHTEFYALPPEEDDEDGEGEDDEDEPHGSSSEDEGEEEQGDESGDAVDYSQKLRDEMAMMRRTILALHVASDPQFALDLGTFIMVDDACRKGWNGMPSELRAREPSFPVSGFQDDSPAAQAWKQLDDGLDRSWLEHKTLEARYDAFCDLADEARAAWLGWAVARTLHPTRDGGTGRSFLDHLGAKLQIDTASWWRPTFRNFFDRLTRTKILDLFQGIGGLELKSRYTGARKIDLGTSAEKLFSGDAIVEAEVKERAVAWVPDPMRFPSLVAVDDTDTVTGADGDDQSGSDGVTIVQDGVETPAVPVDRGPADIAPDVVVEPAGANDDATDLPHAA
ncbi:ParB/RepB/Spo0J family partition protein [Sphingomonas oryzagri]